MGIHETDGTRQNLLADPVKWQVAIDSRSAGSATQTMLRYNGTHGAFVMTDSVWQSGGSTCQSYPPPTAECRRLVLLEIFLRRALTDVCSKEWTSVSKKSRVEPSGLNLDDSTHPGRGIRLKRLLV